MKKLNLFSNLWSSLVGSQKDESRTRLRVVFDSFTCRLRVCPLKLVSVLAILLTIGVGNVWGADPVATLSFTKACGGTGTDSEGNSWTISSDVSESTYSSTQGIHYGTNDVAVDHVNISTTAITSTVSQVVVEASRGGNTVSLSVSVGGTDFKCGQNTSVALTTSNDSYTFTGSASGTILVHLYKPGGSATKKAIYCKSVSVTHAAGSTKTLVYDANGATGGSVPTDATAYNVGDKATVIGNTGSLYKIGHTFAGWTDNSAGTGTVYVSGDKFTIASSGNKLYAKWTNTYAGDEFTLVEDLSDLSAGSKIVILDKDHATALSTEQGSNNRTSVAVTASPAENTQFAMSNSDKTVTLGSATTVQVITLEDLATPAANKYQFNVEDGYLYAASSSSNYLRTQTSNDANGHWEIGLTEGVFSVVAQGTNTNKVLQKNNSSAFFSCYSSASQKKVLIYVKDEGTKYTITWDKNGHGTAPTSPTSASKVTLPDISTTGWTNTGWKADKAVTNVSTSSSISAGTLITNGTRVQLGANTTFTAQWSVKSHTLAWNWNGGSTSSESYTTAGTKDFGSTITYPADNTMSKTGYDFSSWSSSPSGNPTSMPDEDLTITANWTAKKYDVTLKPTSQTGSLTDQVVQATYDAAMPLVIKTAGTAIVIPERTGYSFTGWFDAESDGNKYYNYNAGTSTLSSAASWNKTSATNLYAQWSINSYTLTWATVRGKVTTAGTGADVNATGNVSSSQEYNTALTAPVCGSANGYTFTGWSPSVATNMPAANTTYTAQWSANVYTVTLDNQSATTAGEASVSATFGQAMPSIASNLPAKTGYRFDGYYTAKNGGGTKYYNADGSSATNMAMYSANPKLYANWVAQLTFSVNGVIDAELTRDDNTAMPSTAAVPTACGDCWAFMGWSTNSSESGAPAYAGGATHEFAEPTTLYAVYGKAEFELIDDLSDIEADEYYVLSMLNDNDEELALKNATHSTYTTYADVVDITSDLKHNASGWFLYNPSPAIVWKLTGAYSSGKLYNEAAEKYIDLSSNNDDAILQESTDDNLKFTKFSSSLFNIASTTTPDYFLYMFADDDGIWGVDDDHDGYSSCYIYKRQSATYATEPGCETYDIVWKVDDTSTSAGSPTEETNACAGIEALPTKPADDALDCATKFMGWSETKLIGTGHSAPADLFTKVEDAPAINEDKTFYAVFASVDAENTMEVTDNLTYSAIGLGYAGNGETYTSFENVSSSSSAEYAGQVLRFRSSYSGDGTHNYIQIRSKDSNTGIVTTSSGGLAKKVTITWNTNQSVAKAINVYGKNTAYSAASELFNSSTYGTLLGTITYGTNTELTISGDYAFIGLCSSDGAFYMDNIAIEWEAPAYKDYMTSCCDKLVVLSTNSPSNGTIVFDPVSPIATCDANQNVTMTITPAAGYKLSEWTVATGDGKVAASSTSPAVVTGEDNSDEQEIALTFNQHLSGTYAVSATFEAMHDEYYDYMHDNAKVGANRTGSYSAPSRTSKTAGKTANDCKGNHYKFKGWVVSSEINDDGTLKSGYTLITAGTSMSASNKIYYAVWAEEE